MLSLLDARMLLLLAAFKYFSNGLILSCFTPHLQSQYTVYCTIILTFLQNLSHLLYYLNMQLWERFHKKWELVCNPLQLNIAHPISISILCLFQLPLKTKVFLILWTLPITKPWSSLFTPFKYSLYAFSSCFVSFLIHM